jgi:hypothetical protein
VAGSEIEDAGCGPVGEQAHDFAQVGLGLDVVQVTAADERAEGGVHLGTIVASDKQPIFSSDRLPAQLPLGDIVRGR